MCFWIWSDVTLLLFNALWNPNPNAQSLFVFHLLLGESSASNYSWRSEKCNLQSLLLMERVIVIRKWREREMRVKGFHSGQLWRGEWRLFLRFEGLSSGFWERTTPGRLVYRAGVRPRETLILVHLWRSANWSLLCVTSKQISKGPFTPRTVTVTIKTECFKCKRIHGETITLESLF